MSEQTATGSAIEQREMGPGALVAQYKDDFALVLPTHINVDQWVRVSQGLLRRNPQLANVAKRNPGSFLQAMLRCAHLGLEPGDTFHLVPFGNEIQGITDYTGEIELIYRAGAASSVIAEIVYANDEFDYNPGVHDRPQHKPDWFGNRGEMIGGYAYAVMANGATSRVVVMSKAEIEKVRNVSKTAKRSDSPWQQWPDRMWRKTLVKQLKNWVPSSPEYRQQVLQSQSALGEIGPDLAGQLPGSPERAAYEDIDDEVADGEIVDEGAA